ncbi:MAG TPA: DUF4058 family protein [Caldilineaceae bacterium]|nr:DUF4058 family protein [Caldilineaceae bacterium]
MEPMQSPFPGMDPYLEEPAVWSSVHVRLINAISDYLSPRVLPNFFVDIQQHVYIITPDDLQEAQIVPDIYVVHTPKSSATATLHTITPPTLVEPVRQVEVHEQWIEIRDKQNRAVVTVIELLSPFNKAAGTIGQRAFQEKRRKVMTSDTHWLEIDLLRAGARPPEVTGKSHYYALLKRADHLIPYEVWYFDLRDTLPTIAVPLHSPSEDVPLDLPAVFADMYRRAYYAESINYLTDVPLPRFKPADAAWVQRQINSWQQMRGA